MLTDAKVAPTIPVGDIKRARKFYQDTLGLKVMMEDPSPGVMFQSGGGTMLYIYQRAPSSCEHTLATFAVDNIETEMRDLKAKGVKFEEYDLPSMGIKTQQGTAIMGDMKNAWFRDTEGNILALTEMPEK